MSDTVLNPHASTNTSDGKSALLQEFNDLKEFLKILHNKYTKYKILYDAIQDCVSHPDDLLGSELKAKVQNIVIAHNCAQVNDLDSNHFSEDAKCVLGVRYLNIDELNYNESVKLQKTIETVLQNKYTSICDNFYKLTGENICMVSPVGNNFGDFNLSSEDSALLELKIKVEEQRKKYFCNLLKEQEILEDMVKLRLDNLPEICNRKVEECRTKLQMTELRSKIVQEKTRVEIFMETNNSRTAFEELMKDIREQQNECQKDIQYLQKLKEKYKHVACKQFDELLKSYVQYKSSLEKKKMLYESLQS